MDIHNIAPPEWVAARKALVKELTCLRHRLSCGMPNPFAAIEQPGARLPRPGAHAPDVPVAEVSETERRHARRNELSGWYKPFAAVKAAA